MILFQNIDVYAPEYLGRKDVLTVYDKIVKIADAGTIIRSNTQKEQLHEKELYL